MDKVKILIFMFLLTSSCLAEELNYDFLKNVEITLKQSKEAETFTDDEKLAKAISKASLHAYSIKEDLQVFSYEMVLLEVKKCRYFYDKNKETMDFIEYIKNNLDKHYVNCDNWVRYYKAFLED